MNKKRFFYLLAFLLILAAIIVPTVVNSNRGDSGPVAETAAPTVATENSPVAEKGSGIEEKAAPQTPARISDTKDQTERGGATPAAPVKAGPVQSPSVQPGCRVGVAVIGIGSELLYPPSTVNVSPGNKWGITALGALDATGLPYTMKPMWQNFVDSIRGQACKGVAGWMYMVNGEIPMHLADKHPVKEGDKVIWWYSESMDQEPPSWDKLKK
ncbi:MAG: DUF4430 domain-containing protein [Firmicutes bacterium]|nr:DUF4430 domain-containing protein [Bacillota bacterium]